MGGRIVVGVDGSESSMDALRWALDEAKLRDAELIALHAFTVPALAGEVPFGGSPLAVDWESDAHHVLGRAVEDVTSDSGFPVQKRLVQKPAAQALIRASQNADLLVVGSRGHGGFSGLLLGSVSQHCANHSSCPTVIVRHLDDAQTRSRESS